MAFRERIGCFLLVAGGAIALIYAVPIWSKLQQDPSSVPLDWLAVLAAACAAIWLGWKLYRAGRRTATSLRRPSLAERAYNRWKGDEKDDPSSKSISPK